MKLNPNRQQGCSLIRCPFKQTIMQTNKQTNKQTKTDGDLITEIPQSLQFQLARSLL